MSWRLDTIREMPSERLAPACPDASVDATRAKRDNWPHGGVRISGLGGWEKQRFRLTSDPLEVIWAAALFAGEGYAHSVDRRSGSARRPSAALRVKMLDGRAVEVFAGAFGLHFRMGLYPRDPSRVIYEVSVAGVVAEQVLQAIFPYLNGTAKAEQVKRVASSAEIQLPSMPQRSLGTETLLEGRVSGGSPRRRRAAIVDMSRFDCAEVAWASGLFVAEGHARVITRRARGKSYRHPMLSVSMLDRGAIENFALAIGARPYSFPYYEDKSRTCHRVQISGMSAEMALRAMYPFLSDTDKGDQIRAVFSALGRELNSDGSGEIPKHSNGLKGRTLSDAHRKAIADGQRRRWQRRRRGL